MAELVVLKGSFANFLDTDDSTRVQITSPAIENTDTIILDAGGAPATIGG